MEWVLSAIATGLGLISIWLYGDGTLLAPITSLLSLAVWAAYAVLCSAPAVLVSVIPNVLINLRNLYVMWKRPCD